MRTPARSTTAPLKADPAATPMSSPVKTTPMDSFTWPGRTRVCASFIDVISVGAVAPPAINSTTVSAMRLFANKIGASRTHIAIVPSSSARDNEPFIALAPYTIAAAPEPSANTARIRPARFL